MAAQYAIVFRTWLPHVEGPTLLARPTGRDQGNLKAWIDATKGHAKTTTFVESGNVKSICTCCLAPALPV
jgi:hypothetical protein